MRRGKRGEERNKCGEGGVTRKGDYARLTTNIAEKVIAGAGENAAAITAHETHMSDLGVGRSSGHASKWSRVV